MREAGTYDSIIKGLFQPNRPSALSDLLTGGIPVRQILNVEMARILERRADLVFLLEGETILHLEFQTRNDKEMPYREGIYGLLLGEKYKRRVRQTVIYLGQPQMRMFLWHPDVGLYAHARTSIGSGCYANNHFRLVSNEYALSKN